MKIAITADPEIPVPPILYGGIERIVEMLVSGLISEGHEVTLFAHSESRVNCKLVSWKGLKSSNYIDTLNNALKLLKYVISNKYDIIHSFSRLAYLTPLMPLCVPKIMSYQREPSLAQIKKASHLARKKTILFTGCSNYITNQISDVAKAQTVYNGVIIDKYTATEKVTENAPLVFLGRLEPIKGTHIAIEVAKKTGKPLIIAGNIPAEAKTYFAEMIEPHLCAQISYIGPVNDKQKDVLLGRACGLLMPIQWNEPFGIVMAEAMACGTPVIGFPFGAVPEVIEDGINGFICQDVNDMVLKVGQIKNINRKFVRQIAEEKFSNTVIVQKYLDIYKRMISKA